MCSLPLVKNAMHSPTSNYTPCIADNEYTLICNPSSDLQINFDVGVCDYLKIVEGSTSLEPPIILQFITNQNSFTVTLTPSSIGTVETLGLGGLSINTMAISQGSRATAGWWTTCFIESFYSIITFNRAKNIHII